MPDNNAKQPITYRRWFLEELFNAVADLAETTENARSTVADTRRDAVRTVLRAAGVTLDAFLDGALDAPVPATMQRNDPLDAAADRETEDRCDGCGNAIGETWTFVRVAAYGSGSQQDRVRGIVCTACANKLAPAIATLRDAVALGVGKEDRHAV